MQSNKFIRLFHVPALPSLLFSCHLSTGEKTKLESSFLCLTLKTRRLLSPRAPQY